MIQEWESGRQAGHGGDVTWRVLEGVGDFW